MEEWNYCSSVLLVDGRMRNYIITGSWTRPWACDRWYFALLSDDCEITKACLCYINAVSLLAVLTILTGEQLRCLHWQLNSICVHLRVLHQASCTLQHQALYGETSLALALPVRHRLVGPILHTSVALVFTFPYLIPVNLFFCTHSDNDFCKQTRRCCKFDTSLARGLPPKCKWKRQHE